MQVTGDVYRWENSAYAGHGIYSVYNTILMAIGCRENGRTPCL